MAAIEFLVGSNPTAVTVMLGNGDGTFQAPTTYATGNLPDLLIAADFNGDGKLDIAVANQNDTTVSILLGNGDGTFQPQIAFAVCPNPAAMFAADLNHDGKVDLVVESATTTGLICVLQGNGDGTFQTEVDYPVGTSGLDAMTVGDFNGDGNLDVAVVAYPASGISENLWILLGNGDGTFQSPLGAGTVNIEEPGGASIAADLNGDGKLDLAITWIGRGDNGGVWVLLGNGDGTFAPAISYPSWPDQFPRGIAAGDFNSDGKLDLAVTADGLASEDFFVFLGNGDGTFQSGLAYPTPSHSGVPVIADFNGDGKLDLATAQTGNTATGGPGTPEIAVFLQGLAGFAGVSLSPQSLTFGSQAIGTSSPTQTVTLSNTGNVTLDISSIAIAGANAGDFAQINNCSTVNAGATCLIWVTCTPLAPGGNVAAAVTVTDNAPGKTQTIPLTGSTPNPLASLSPLQITFTSQYVGTSGLPQTVTLTNTGAVSLTITSVSTSPADFGSLNACGSSVAAGSSCSIGVFFDPTTTGTRTGTLTIADNATDSPQTVALTGTGQDFSIAPGGSATVTVAPGQTASYQVALAPSGGFDQTVGLSCTGAPSGSTCAVSQSSVLLNGSTATTITVTVATMARSMVSYAPPNRPVNSSPMVFAFALFGIALAASGLQLARIRRRCVSLASLVLIVSVLTLLPACGGGAGNSGGGSSGTTAGTYPLTVTGTFSSGSTTLTHTTNLTLVVQ